MTRDEVVEKKTKAILKGFKEELVQVQDHDVHPMFPGPILQALVRQIVINMLPEGALLAEGLASDLEIGAYNAGRDYAYNGPNGGNSDEALLENEKTRVAWNRGNQDGHAEIASAKDVAEGA